MGERGGEEMAVDRGATPLHSSADIGIYFHQGLFEKILLVGNNDQSPHSRTRFLEALCLFLHFFPSSSQGMPMSSCRRPRRSRPSFSDE